MGDQLIVRLYNVELGDCIFVRIPNGQKDFCILIDCGTKGSIALLQAALKDIETILPADEETGKKRLDLLVATHRHADHIKGFDPSFFENIAIKNIWLSALMDSEHPQAETALKLERYVTKSLRGIEKMDLNLSPELEMLYDLFSINNEGAEKALKEILPAANDIEPKYMYAGKSTEYLQLEEAKITILGPENDIDGYYLGDEIDEELKSVSKFQRKVDRATDDQADSIVPNNISVEDFRILKTRMLSDAFAFAEVSSKVTNNASVVLLIEWRGNRLLFVGDTEWNGIYKKRKKNGGWNVMWHTQRQHLDAPIDFLKIGHHGSHNSTPWDGEEAETYEVNQILNAILPLPSTGTTSNAIAVVSTERSSYKSIPKADMLVELGRRIKNTRNYRQAFEDKGINIETAIQNVEREIEFLGQSQPSRTDFEKLLEDSDFLEFKFDPKF